MWQRGIHSTIYRNVITQFILHLSRTIPSCQICTLQSSLMNLIFVLQANCLGKRIKAEVNLMQSQQYLIFASHNCLQTSEGSATFVDVILLLSHFQLFCDPHGLQPTRLLCPWDSPGKNAGMGCHFLLQGIFLIQGLNSYLLHQQVDFFTTEPPWKFKVQFKIKKKKRLLRKKKM